MTRHHHRERGSSAATINSSEGYPKGVHPKGIFKEDVDVHQLVNQVGFILISLDPKQENISLNILRRVLRSTDLITVMKPGHIMIFVTHIQEAALPLIMSKLKKLLLHQKSLSISGLFLPSREISIETVYTSLLRMVLRSGTVDTDPKKNTQNIEVCHCARGCEPPNAQCPDQSLRSVRVLKEKEVVEQDNVAGVPRYFIDEIPGRGSIPHQGSDSFPWV